MTPEDLVEIREIEQLKYRYLRCVDLKLWSELETVLTEDARASYGGGAYAFEGRTQILDFLVATMSSSDVLTSHKCHHPEITLAPDGLRATGIWALDDVVVQQQHDVTIRGAAYYDDAYVKVDGRWLISVTGYRRVYEELFPRASVAGLKVTGDYWSTDGRSRLGGAAVVASAAPAQAGRT